MEQEIRACLDRKRYQEAFDLLLPEFQNKVFRLAYAMVGDAALAEDMAQEVFIRIWKALPGFRGQSALSTWIYAITRNTCLTALKKGTAKRESSLEEPNVARAVEEAGVPAARHAEIDVLRFLDQLPQRCLRLHPVTQAMMNDRKRPETVRLLRFLHRLRQRFFTSA